jgi:hypothetical protein
MAKAMMTSRAAAMPMMAPTESLSVATADGSTSPSAVTTTKKHMEDGR